MGFKPYQLCTWLEENYQISSCPTCPLCGSPPGRLRGGARRLKADISAGTSRIKRIRR